MQSTGKMRGLEKFLHALAIVALFILGSDMSGVEGNKALTLQLPLAWVTYVSPILAAALYIIVGFLLRRTRMGRWGWVVSYFVGALVSAAPSAIVSTFAQPIQLTRWLSPEELLAVNARFQHPHVEYSATSEGTRLLIRRRDYDPSLVAYLESIHATPEVPNRTIPQTTER
jgi:hypothetical protein